MEDWLEMNYTEAATGDFTGKHLYWSLVLKKFQAFTTLDHIQHIVVVYLLQALENVNMLDHTKHSDNETGYDLKERCTFEEG